MSDSDKPRKRQSLLSAFKHAFEGIGQTIVRERNMKIHLVFAVLAVVLGFALHISQLEWIPIVILIGLVMSLEVLNSALEAVVDLASPGWHELAKRAKDCAAGAVLVCAIAAIIVACIIFLPRMYCLLA